MPRAGKQPPELDPKLTYVAWQSFAVEIGGYRVDVQKGQRLRGDHPTVTESCLRVGRGVSYGFARALVQVQYSP
jgi:hypothetical protein